ncbi:hypothetical protein NT04LM_3514 [Listeria monocytogenes FSL F2-208]|nr:hypothetical protein NT04LM_3514 [Listeria monocytogenes FSL F2-208]
MDDAKFSDLSDKVIVYYRSFHVKSQWFFAFLIIFPIPR